MKITKQLIYLIALGSILVVTSSHKHHQTYFISKGAYMKKQPALSPYEQRRNFSKTTEPIGAIKKQPNKKQPIFVIQKHAASHLHYDFRLEIDGVLKSWAIPKGPSTDPGTKHLAIPTDDHPLEYATFEGVIPEGQYGAGTVMVWDIGTFDNIKLSKGQLKPIEQCYKDGQIEVFLHGKKLQGAYALLLIKSAIYKNESWLLIKIRDEYANIPHDPVKTEPNSALTGRTMEEIKKESDG
jgi:DNA ligase D-like protein (predicted 3'-phosphoesterase)